jgi:hypothetical protein
MHIWNFFSNRRFRPQESYVAQNNFLWRRDRPKAQTKMGLIAGKLPMKVRYLECFVAVTDEAVIPMAFS